MTNALNEMLTRYVYDQENANNNFNLAVEYDKLNQGAAAISYYLRAAERTQDDMLSYYCLIRMAQLFTVQTNRARTVHGLYKIAIAFKPERSEAYYCYSKLLESEGDNITSYLMCELGLRGEVAPRNDFIGYPGPYGLLFQKSVASWWVGKPKEARIALHNIIDKHMDSLVLDAGLFNCVKNNLNVLGTGSETNAFKQYKKANYNKLRFKFPGCDKIDTGYGQVMQDLFVLSVLNGKRKGTYLEIGSCYAYRGNNTVLLEKEFEWTGIGIEYDENYVNDYRAHRSNPVIHADALKVNYDEVLSKIAVDGVVDYLQLDCEPSNVTYEIMERIPFDKYKFAVITYEHDHHIDMTRSYRDKSRKFLEERGYELLVGNVSPDEISAFEDWWIHPDLINKNIARDMKNVNNKVLEIEKYMFDK
jgi:tetratricopeptide (TPR) repeat protein